MEIILELPPDLYELAERLALAKAQPIQELLVEQLEESLHDPLAGIAAEEQTELRALVYLSDEALWTIAREKMPLDKQNQLQLLMDKNNFGDLSDAEQTELDNLVEQGQKLMLRKAQASVILVERGHQVTIERL